MHRQAPPDTLSPSPPRRSAPSGAAAWWHRHGYVLRALGVSAALGLCGVLVMILVRQETGPEGFLVGLGLALLPLPLLLGLFRWIDRVEPRPWRNLAFAFAWGSCAATLMALVANGLVVGWLTGDTASMAPSRADTLELTVVAPVIEESAKAAAILLLFLHRPGAFDGVTAGLVTAGVTATGFAFTENILYLGSAFADDRMLGTPAIDSATATTFFVRIVMAPLAHPLFTALTGVGFGLAALLPVRRKVCRVLLPVTGLAAAMGLHSAWNASTSLALLGFGAVYLLLMLPLLGLLGWLAVWSQQSELRAIRDTLPAYAEAGWLAEPEPHALGSLRSRALARRLARRDHGPAGARAVAGYQSAATSLALLRRRADRGVIVPDFTAREMDLLLRLRRHQPLAAGPTIAAALAEARPHIPAHW